MHFLLEMPKWLLQTGSSKVRSALRKNLNGKNWKWVSEGTSYDAMVSVEVGQRTFIGLIDGLIWV